MSSQRSTRPEAVLTLTGPATACRIGTSLRPHVGITEMRMDKIAPELWSSHIRETTRHFARSRLLLTLRLERDGGAWPTATPRHESLKRLLDLHRWDFIDIEDDHPDRDSLLQLREQYAPQAGVVLSRHQFVPCDADEMFDQLNLVRTHTRETHASVAKWAGLLQDLSHAGPQLLRMLHAWEDAATPAIFPMGWGSEAWRVAASLVCNGWGYAHDGSGPAAPGQLAWPVFHTLLGSVPVARNPDADWLAQVQKTTALALSELPDS